MLPHSKSNVMKTATYSILLSFILLFIHVSAGNSMGVKEIYRGVISGGAFKAGHPGFAKDSTITQFNIIGLFLNDKPIQLGFMNLEEWLSYIYNPKNSYLPNNESGIAIAGLSFPWLEKHPLIIGYTISHEDTTLEWEAQWIASLERRLNSGMRPIWLLMGPKFTVQNVFTQFLVKEHSPFPELAVKEAMVNGWVFASTGPKIIETSVDKYTIKVRFSDSVNIFWLGPNQTTKGLQWLSHKTGITSDSYTMKSNGATNTFIRFVAEKNGKYGFSSPIFLRNGKVENPYQLPNSFWIKGAAHMNPMIKFKSDLMTAFKYDSTFKALGYEGVFFNSYNYWPMQMARLTKEPIPYIEKVIQSQTMGNKLQIEVIGRNFQDSLIIKYGTYSKPVVNTKDSLGFRISIDEKLLPAKYDLTIINANGYKFNYPWAFSVKEAKVMTETFDHFDETNFAFLSDVVNKVIVIDSNIAWFATNEGILKQDNGKWINFIRKSHVKFVGSPSNTIFVEDSNMASPIVYDMAKDVNGNVWFATFYGVCYHGINGWARKGEEKDFPHNEIYSITSSPTGEIVVLCKKGPLIFKTNHWIKIPGFPQSLYQFSDIREIVIANIPLIMISSCYITRGGLSHEDIDSGTKRDQQWCG